MKDAPAAMNSPIALTAGVSAVSNPLENASDRWRNACSVNRPRSLVNSRPSALETPTVPEIACRNSWPPPIMPAESGSVRLRRSSSAPVRSRSRVTEVGILLATNTAAVVPAPVAATTAIAAALETALPPDLATVARMAVPTVIPKARAWNGKASSSSCSERFVRWKAPLPDCWLKDWPGRGLTKWCSLRTADQVPSIAWGRLGFSQVFATRTRWDHIIDEIHSALKQTINE